MFASFQARLKGIEFTAIDAPPARHLPVADCLAILCVRQDQPAKILDAVKAHRHSLAWGQTYNAQDFGRAFLQNYGWVGLVGPTAPVRSKAVLCALMALGPHTLYPLHRHHAEEIYVCIAGDLEIRQDTNTWHRCDPGGFSHQRSLQPHALRTGDKPALMIALWLGENLAEKSEILERPSDSQDITPSP